jgi:hypothetical protein
MKTRSLSLALLFACSMWALPTAPVTFTDDLASQNPADVIGDPKLFDIHYVTFSSPSANTLQIDIRFNYGGGSSLGGFTIPGFIPTLNVGDLFLRTDEATYAYVLNSHNGLATNGLYEIDATQSAKSVLGNPAGYYRPDAQVWASPTGAQLLGTGVNTVSTVGGNNTYLLSRIVLSLPAGALSDLNGGFDFYFASATCGNDEIMGTVPADVPEPGTWAMLGSGLLAVGFLRRRA